MNFAADEKLYNFFYFTGTPPRLKKSTIDLSKFQAVGGDDPPVPFSFMNSKVWLERENMPQLFCHLAYTNEKVHTIIKDNMHLNRHVIEEVTGPRYCPSIESKILRFGQKSPFSALNMGIFYPVLSYWILYAY